MVKPLDAEYGGQDVSVRLEGFDRLYRRTEGLEQRLRGNIIRGGVRAAVAVFARGVKRRLPVKTGTLLASVRSSTRVKFGGQQVEGKVYIGSRVGGGSRRGAKGAARGAFYAHMLEGGTKPHEITARSARAIKLAEGYAQFGVNATFRGRVRHPGIRPMRTWAITRQAEAPAANAAFERYVEQRVAAYWGAGRG